VVSVSVVIPCYNYGHLLPACLASVLTQEGVEVRVLVIDDASPDGSGAVALRLAEEDPRVTTIVHEVNAGHIATYNEGLGKADGDYVVLLSADDMLVPGSLQRATAVMEADPRVGFVYGYSLYFNDEGPYREPRTTGGRTRVYRGQDWIARRCRNADNMISSPEVVVRTSLQHEVGGYRSDLPHAGDLEMWLRLAARADVGVVTGVDQALYRVHEKSMSRTTFAASAEELQQRHRAFEVFFETSGDRLQRAGELRAQARLASARRAAWRAGRLIRLGDAQSVEAAHILARFAVRLCPAVERTPEFRAWRWASGRGSVLSPDYARVALTALRGRVQDRLYWRARERRCA
jgi:GT2 family glycosyltransferase